MGDFLTTDYRNTRIRDGVLGTAVASNKMIRKVFQDRCLHINRSNSLATERSEVTLERMTAPIFAPFAFFVVPLL